MIKTSLVHNYSLSPSPDSGYLTNNWMLTDGWAEQTQSAGPFDDIKRTAARQSVTHSHSVGLRATDSHADSPPLGTRRCAWLDQVNNLHIISGRAQWGGKGMYLMVLRDVGLMVPPFCCIEGGVWQRLENVSMDLSPLLSVLEDGHEYGHSGHGPGLDRGGGSPDTTPLA